MNDPRITLQKQRSLMNSILAKETSTNESKLVKTLFNSAEPTPKQLISLKAMKRNRQLKNETETNISKGAYELGVTN